MRPLGVVVGLLDQLLRAGDTGAQEVALALVLELVAQDVGLGGVDRRLGLLDKRLLHDPLIGEIGERRLGGGEIGLSQLELGLIVGRVDHREKVALAHELEVIDRHFGDVPGHPGRKRRHIARHEGVVGRFEPRRAGPAVPMSGGVPDEPGGEDEKGGSAKGERASASSSALRQASQAERWRSVAFRSSRSREDRNERKVQEPGERDKALQPGLACLSFRFTNPRGQLSCGANHHAEPGETEQHQRPGRGFGGGCKAEANRAWPGRWLIQTRAKGSKYGSSKQEAVEPEDAAEGIGHDQGDREPCRALQHQEAARRESVNLWDRRIEQSLGTCQTLPNTSVAKLPRIRSDCRRMSGDAETLLDRSWFG